MKVHVKTLGCRLNLAESERIAQGFVLAGHDVTDESEEAELIVLNSCTVTGEAARKSVRAVERRVDQKLVVTGCHSEVSPEAFRDASLIVANAEKDNLVALTAQTLGTEGFALGADYRSDAELNVYPLVLDHTRAFVKIQDGCNLSCSFCLTTIARGDARSRPTPSVLAEVRRLASLGCQEVVLTGVHAGAYGLDGGSDCDLGELIDLLLLETEIPRVRLSSLEPWNFRPNWLGLWSKWGERLCRHLHMSLQSGSDPVLRRMRRAYTTEAFAEKVAAARAAIPQVAISTDLIVGFPGETETEHQESLQFVEEIGFAGAHVFTFSPRPGTRASTMPRQVANQVKKRRYQEMKSVMERTAAEYRERMRGTVQPVLWERRDEDGEINGLTDTYLRVHTRKLEVSRNQLVAVRLGRLVGDSFEAEFLRAD